MKKYVDFLFEDEECGELFFVEIVKTEEKTTQQCKVEAMTTAEEYFESPVLRDIMDAATAEFYGYDTY